MSVEFEKLIRIMEKMRSPDEGCSWTISQTFQTIIPYTIEETYEVADAIDRKDWDELKSELGDLLYNVLFHIQIGQEKELFNFEDVCSNLIEKLIERNPHIFSDGKAKTPEEIDAEWHKIKAKKNDTNKASSNKSVLDDVTQNLPSLLRSSKLMKRAASVGFEWKSEDGFKGKFEEEYQELLEAIKSDVKEDIEDEFGDVFMCLSNWARSKGINPEEALRKCNQKFYTRFSGLEFDAANEGKKVSDLTSEEFRSLWQEQKRKEKQ